MTHRAAAAVARCARRFVVVLLWGTATLSHAFEVPPTRPPDRVIAGEIGGAAHRSVRREPILVPEGVSTLAVRFEHDGKAERTVIDIGLEDVHGFRGWSGGNKSYFEVGRLQATPSYLPGPVQAGLWHLVLSVPNIRPDSVARFRAEVWFLGAADSGRPSAVLRDEPGWYRGDLHLHTGHSDGTCSSMSGRRVPCPVHRLAQRAADEGLDFIAITDHNTVSHFQTIAELQPYFDRLLILPGVELTTFWGHANLVGVQEAPDHVTATRSPRDLAEVIARARRNGALAIVNHPGLPSGEACMGCGWGVPEQDRLQVDAVEVFNGSSVFGLAGLFEGPLSGLPTWIRLAVRGHRATVIGASDNHDPNRARDNPGAVGRPATVVQARNLSAGAILDGIRAGRVFVDLEGVKGRTLDLVVETGHARAAMGSILAVSAGQRVVAHAAGSMWPVGTTVQWMINGEPAGERTLPIGSTNGQLDLSFAYTPRAGTGQFVYVNVRDASGRLLAMSNPVYLDVL